MSILYVYTVTVSLCVWQSFIKEFYYYYYFLCMSAKCCKDSISPALIVKYTRRWESLFERGDETVKVCSLYTDAFVDVLDNSRVEDDPREKNQPSLGDRQ